MSADLSKKYAAWAFNSAQLELFSKISQESGLTKRHTPRADTLGGKSGLVASLFAHLVLIAFFMIGLNWNTEKPVPIQAMLWSETTSTEISPTEQTAPPLSTPKPAAPSEKPKAERREKIVEQKKADINLAKLEPKKPESKKKPELKPKNESKVEPKPKVEPKIEPKVQAPKKPEIKPEKKLDPDVINKLRQDELARIMGSAPNIGNPSSGVSKNKAQYSDKLRQYVRSKLVFPGADSVSGNPEAVFEVRQLPNGEVVSVTQRKSSGLPAWDNAVERALQRSSPLPKAEDGSVEPMLILSFRPKDI